jgi:hypothetical protein
MAGEKSGAGATHSNHRNLKAKTDGKKVLKVGAPHFIT